MKKINVKKALKLLKKDNYYLIDIRSPYLFNQGHFPDSFNIPYDALIKIIPKYLNKDYSYLIICESGNDSKEIVKILLEHNYKAYHIKGGINRYRDLVVSLNS